MVLRTKLAWPQKETDLAGPVIAYLTDLKWDVYQEVQTGSGGSVADLVAVQGRLVWVIELKKTLSLEVMAQADHWLRYANYSSVAVPRSGRRSSGRAYAERIMALRGIGMLEVRGPQDYGDPAYDEPAQVCPPGRGIQPKLMRRAMTSKIRDGLCEMQKTYAVAGNADGRRWTPFKQTCAEVERVAKKSPGLSMKELVSSIKHHYASDAGARGSLASWITQGIVEGVEIRREGKHLRVYPKEAHGPEGAIG